MNTKKNRRVPVFTLLLLVLLLTFTQLLFKDAQARINAQVKIDGTAEDVWHALTAFEAYSEWNPYIIQADGEVKKGAQLTMTLQPTKGETANWTPTLFTVEEKSSLRYGSGMFFPKLFDQEHEFVIEPAGEGTVRVVHTETFTGSLVQFRKQELAADYQRAMLDMLDALKVRVEAQ